MHAELFIADGAQFDADPSAHADIRRAEELLWLAFDQHGLQARRRSDPHGDVSIVVMIVGEHCIDFLFGEEGRLAVRDFFRTLRQGGADPADALQVFFAER